MTEELALQIADEILGVPLAGSAHERDIVRLTLVPQAVFVLSGLPDPDDFLVDVPNRTLHVLSGTTYIAVTLRRHSDAEGESHILEADATAVSLAGAAVTFTSEFRHESAEAGRPAMVRDWTFTPAVGDPIRITGRTNPMLPGPGAEDHAETFAESMSRALGFTVGASGWRVDDVIDDDFTVDED